MKKYLIVLCVLLLISCKKNGDGITENALGKPIVIEDYDYVGTFENGDELYIDAYRYHMQDAAWEMILVRDDQVVKLFSGSPSRPQFSIDRTKILYVDSLQFEAIGNVTIYDSEAKTETTYTDFGYEGKQMTVKDVEWFDNESILCIVGYGAGTITQGGMLYQLNLSSKELALVLTEKKIEEWTDRPYEVADIYTTDNGLEIMLVEWSDDNQEDYYYTMHHLYVEETGIQ